jgi:hypothetical protein
MASGARPDGRTLTPEGIDALTEQVRIRGLGNSMPGLLD